MSALARYFNARGIRVGGYDKTSTVLTKQLEQEGIAVHYEDDIELADKLAELVVYTPAIPAGHTELMFYQQNGYTVLKRSDVLSAVTNSSFNICVAGTHGKTTISTMIAHILRHSGYGCNAFLGGIAVNYNSNFWSSEKNVCVIEADEYDRSFLKLLPDIAIITSMDADHLDIYGTPEQMEEAFIAFAGKLRPGGLLISKFGLKRSDALQADQRLTYHLENERADVFARNIVIRNGSYQFDAVLRTGPLQGLQLNMGGMHNIENALAAIAVARHLGIADEKIGSAIADFRGVRRRFEYIVKNDNQVYIDDYAHHPEELRALLSGAKALYPGKPCTVIFQPHLFSRTRDLADGFANSLDLADEVVLLPIYPARELPVAGVTSALILDKMKGKNKLIRSKEETLDWIRDKKHALIITAGAGDIDRLVEPIKQILETESGK